MTKTIRAIAFLAAASLAMAAASVAAAADSTKIVVVDCIKSLGEKLYTAVILPYLERTGAIAYAVTKAPTFTGQVPRRNQPEDQSIYEMPCPFTMPAVAPAVNDLLAIAQVYPGVQVVDYLLISEQADTNGAPTASLSIGELASDLSAMSTVYETGIQVQRAGGIARATKSVGFTTAAGSSVKNIGIRFDAAFATYAASKNALLVLRLLG